MHKHGASVGEFEDGLAILLIDDDEDAYVLTRDLLRAVVGLRFKLDWISDPQDAIRVAALGQHDVCLVDYHMGAFTGAEVISALRERGCTTPLILMTGHDKLAADLDSMQAGANDFLVKGETTPAMLERAIRYAHTAELQAQAVRQSEARYRRLFDSTVDGVLVTTAAGKVLAANPAACALFGLTEQALLDTDRQALMESASSDQALTASLGLGSPRTEIRFRRHDGSVFPAEVTTVPFTDGPGIERVSVIIRDVSQRQELEQVLSEGDRGILRLEKVHATFVLGTIALAIGLFFFVGPMAGRALVLLALVGQWRLIVTSRRRRQAALAHTARWQERALHVRDDLLRFIDLSEIDYETGIGNRRHLDLEVQRSVARYTSSGEPFSLALIETLDPNAAPGELSAPALASVLDRLKWSARGEDVIVRLSTTTFGVLLAAADDEAARVFAQKVRDRIGMDRDGRFVVALEVVIGVAAWQQHLTTLDDLIQRAEKDKSQFVIDLQRQALRFLPGVG